MWNGRKRFFHAENRSTRSAVSIEIRLVTDRQTDTDTGRQLVRRLYSVIVIINMHAPVWSVAVFTNCLYVQRSWARRQTLNRPQPSTAHSHAVLGLPAGRFQSVKLNSIKAFQSQTPSIVISRRTIMHRRILSRAILTLFFSPFNRHYLAPLADAIEHPRLAGECRHRSLLTRIYILYIGPTSVFTVNFKKTCTQTNNKTRSSAIAEGPRDASCQLKSCQLPRNSAETTYTTSPDKIDGMKLEI